MSELHISDPSGSHRATAVAGTVQDAEEFAAPDGSPPEASATGAPAGSNGWSVLVRIVVFLLVLPAALMIAVRLIFG